MNVHEDYNTVASKANEFLEQMISFLNNDKRRTKQMNLSTELRKERPTFHKGGITIELVYLKYN
ncbi:unnamed protein product [Brugia pahangi]|uniref:tRNA (Guanine-N(7)-)-methyltransferase n=1 Tax=Brugia pahangi TaxID=6280 RepID=A0A0N4TGL4_BRUPA|nr:unnamed protein product [Brugia pahangi]